MGRWLQQQPEQQEVLAEQFLVAQLLEKSWGK